MRVWYELLDCARHGHVHVGDDAGTVRPEDAHVVVERDGVRWHRCLRCDSWHPAAPPARPARDTIPERHEIALPLRGRPLRDRYVLRLIAIDRGVHFALLGLLSAAIFVLAIDHTAIHNSYLRTLSRLQGASGGPVSDTAHKGLLHDFDRLFAVPTHKLVLYGVAVGVYAVANLVEAVGLWRTRRWAEYLAVIEVAVLLPIDIHELTLRVSPVKLVALVINLAIVGYLIRHHRLFGARGGGNALRAEYEADTGWPAIERATPAPLRPDPDKSAR